MPQSASAIVGAFVFALTIFGMIDASMTPQPLNTEDSECFVNDTHWVVAAAHPTRTHGAQAATLEQSLGHAPLRRRIAASTAAFATARR